MATTTDKIQTLHCQHGEGHDWTRPAQRGKPPKFCPEHTQAKRTQFSQKMAQAKAELDSLDKRVETVEHDPARAEALAKAREAAAKAREERKAREAQEAAQSAKDELSRIIQTMPEVEAAYEKAFDKANRTNKLEDWHSADTAQSRIIGMINRRRALQGIA